MVCPFCGQKLEKLEANKIYSCSTCIVSFNLEKQIAYAGKTPSTQALVDIVTNSPDVVVANAQLFSPEFDYNSLTFLNRKKLSKNIPKSSMTLISFNGILSLNFDKLLSSMLCYDMGVYNGYNDFKVGQNGLSKFLYMHFILANGKDTKSIQDNVNMFSMLKGKRLNPEATLYNFMTSPLRHLIVGKDLNTRFRDTLPVYPQTVETPTKEPELQCYNFYQNSLIQKSLKNEFVNGGIDDTYLSVVCSKSFDMKAFSYYKNLTRLADKYRKELCL